LTVPINPLKIEYAPSNNTAISSIAVLYNSFADDLDVRNEQFILNYLRKTINHCDPNFGTDNIPPIIDVILMRKPDVVAALIARGADINFVVTRKSDDTIMQFTPLYFTETVLGKADDEKSKNAYSQIIEKLKKAGAYSHFEMKSNF
jgi:hypothetical protein